MLLYNTYSHTIKLVFTCGKNERLFVLSAYRLTARNSSRFMSSELELDDEAAAANGDLPAVTEYMSGPSSDTDSRAPVSTIRASGMIPSDRTLLLRVEQIRVSSAGVDCVSSWSIWRHTTITENAQGNK